MRGTVGREDSRRLERDGFVKLRGVLDPDGVRAFGDEVTREVKALNRQHVPLSERDTQGRAFLQVTNLWQQRASVAERVTDPRMGRLAADLLGVADVRLYHDQALYKEPGGGITPWHADQYYWPFASDRCITAWVPLQDTPSDMGPLCFARGSHRVEVGRDLPISDESEALMASELEAYGLDIDDTPYACGDVSFHLGWTFHRAGPNVSVEPRRVMTVIYMDADMTVLEPTAEQVEDLASFLDGRRPGERLDGPLNPMVSGMPGQC